MKTVSLIATLLTILTFAISAMEIKSSSDITEVKKAMKLAGYQRIWLTTVIKDSEHHFTYWTTNHEAVITQHSSKTNKVSKVLYRMNTGKDLKNNSYKQIKSFNTLTQVVVPLLKDAAEKQNHIKPLNPNQKSDPNK